MYKISANTFFIGKKYIYLPSCHSTNDIATNYISNNKVFGGEVFVTSHQKNGRGQRGNSWYTEADKNITLSLILKPYFLNANEQFKLNIAISLGIYNFIQHFIQTGLKIKWPNDIYIKNKKLGGILIENFLKKHSIEHSVIGIGLNINQEEFAGLNATSLYNETKKVYILETLIENLLENIEITFLQLKNGIFEKMKQAYINVLYQYQEKNKYEDLRNKQAQIFYGEILGVNPQGKLAVYKIDEGKVDYFDFKEIRFINS